MSNKFWINRIHSADSRADLSNPISEINNDYAIANGQVEVDLRGSRSENKVSIKSGDIIYIAANGFYEEKSNNSLRIVAKGVVDLIEYRDDTPVAVFVQGSFEYLTAPMINGLDIKNEGNQYPYWSITDDKADYFDQNVFIGNETKSI